MEKQNKVSLWLGKFLSEEVFHDFLKEEYDEEGDAISKFMSAFQIDYIDPGFQEVYFYGNEVTKEKIFEDFSYIDSFLAQIPDQNWEKYNSIILLYNFEYEYIPLENYHIKFLGTFTFEDNESFET
jgi:hypothetical protein